MDRLTERFKGVGMTESEIMHNGHRWGPAFFPDKDGYQEYDAILNRLAAYEDTGLMPDEIPQLQAQLKAALEDLSYIHHAGLKGCEICANKEQCKELGKHIGNCTSFEWRGPQPPKREK